MHVVLAAITDLTVTLFICQLSFFIVDTTAVKIKDAWNVMNSNSAYTDIYTCNSVYEYCQKLIINSLQLQYLIQVGSFNSAYKSAQLQQ